MPGGAGAAPDWLKVKLQPTETIVGSMAAIMWMAAIGAFIASARMVQLVSAAFAVDPPAVTSLISGIGDATVRYWLLSFPLWGLAVAGSFLWALSIPDQRQFRLAILVFALAMVLFVALFGTYLPFAQAAASIAQPPVTSAPVP